VENTTPVKRARHLMDPANPVRQVNDRSLTNVQRWVASALATTTIFHLAAGLVIAAVFMDDDNRVSQIGLCVIAGAFGIIAIGVGLAIHGRRPISPWSVLGLLPTVVGLFLVLR
jgi:CHASE2 domain-containing sensor protein